MAKLTVNEAALQGFTDVVSFEFGEDFKLDTGSGTGVVKTYAVPEGTIITNCSVHKVANFTGGSISDCRLDIGFGGDGSATIDDFIDDAKAVLKEMNLIFSVVDILKLDQDIGL